MSDEVQRLVVEQIWDTTSVEAGSQVIDKALSREQQALDSTTKMVERYNRAVGDMASAKKKAEGGGHGGHGGGGFGENLKWGLHDLAEGRGTQGLFRLTSAFGMAGSAAIVATQAIKYFNLAREQSAAIEKSILSTRESLGLARESSVERNALLRPLARVLPASWFDQGEGGRPERESAGGIAEQRSALQKDIASLRESRSHYWGVWWNDGLKDFTGHDLNEENLRNEGLANDKLFELDQRAADIVKRRSAADWLAATGSSRQGELAKSAASGDEEIAKLDDAHNAGKLDTAEWVARKQAVNQQQAIQDRDIDLRYNAQERARAMIGYDIGDKYRSHAAERIAQNHQIAAAQEEKEAPTKEAKEAAHTKGVVAWEEEQEANRQWRENEARLNAEKEIANYRGRAEDRALHGAERELELARSILSIEKEKGADAEKAAQVQVAAQEKTLALLKEQQAIARINFAAQGQTGATDVWAAGARLRGYSPEQAHRIDLEAHVQNSQTQFLAAAWKAFHSHWDGPSRAGMVSAAQGMQRAQIGLDTFDLDFNRDRSRGLDQARGETDSAQWSAYGRHDLAQLTGQRTQSRLAIEDAEFHSNPELADELRSQQGYREREALTQKYLNADGTRRNPADVQAEELEQRRRQTRIDQFFGGGGSTKAADTDPDGGLHGGSGVETTASRHLANMDAAHDPAKRLAAMTGPVFQGTALSKGAERVGALSMGITRAEHGMDGSIIGGYDALTGKHMNAQEIAEHTHTMKATAARHAENAKDDRSDREIQQEIFKVLDSRLPKDP